jgi:hypothetical protein
VDSDYAAMMTVPVGIGMMLIALAPRDPAGRTGSTLRNGSDARRILKGEMAYQILLDAALIIVAMGALHRFEARRVRSAYVRRTSRIRPVPNPWRKAT